MTISKFNSLKIFVTIFTISIVLICNAFAGGLATYSKGVKGSGNMNAGGAAIAQDASTIYWNPAGMTVLKKSEIEISIFAVAPTIKFTNAETTNNLPTLLGGPTYIQGTNGGNAGEFTLLGNLFWSQKLNDSLSMGLGIVSPFGLSTNYDQAFVGRYYALKSQLFTVDINPSIAYRVNQHCSVGAGLSAQYSDATLTNAIDFGLLRSLPPLFDPTAQPSTLIQDGKAKLQGDGWGYGWNFGILYELSNNTRFGFSYRSKVSTSIKGDVTYLIPNDSASQAIAFANNLFNSDTKTNIEFPATASFSAYHRIGKFGIMGDITWTQWNSLDEIRIKFANGAMDNVTTLKWNNTLEYAVGLDWYYNDNWTFRCGLKYDEAPTPNSELRSPRVPDYDHLDFALGGSYAFNDNWKIDFSGAWIQFFGNSEINKPATNDPNNENFARGALKGEYDIYAYILGLQLNYLF
jgi:long-chain fatty acid transport protein